MVALHQYSDVAIGVAYLAIPAVLLYFLGRRGKAIREFSGLIVTLGLFITSCGAIHFLDAMMSERPLYRLAGLVKLITAISSWATVCVLVRFIPHALTFRSPEQLEEEVSERIRELQQVNATLVATIAEKRKLTAELAERDRRKDQWLAMLAHELRNPLAPIVNAMSIMRLTGSQDEAMERQRQIVERQVENMRRIIEDLLDVSRITQGRIEFSETHLVLCEVVRHAVDACWPLIENKEHQLALEMPDQNIIANGDIMRLEQVIVNLLTNAVKYTHPRGEISIGLRRQPGGWATITVRDNGIGIPTEFLPHIFDLFSQEEASLDRREGGLGIGLTLVKALVAQHGGRIEVYSAGRNQGSEFQVWLPTVEAAPMIAETTEYPPVSAGLSPPDKGQTILIVEDNVDGALSLAELCGLWGHRTEIAYDGWQAEERARERSFDTVLLDIGLPGMDGYEVARRLRGIAGTRGALLICLSGYGTESLKSNWRAAGFDMHMVKPMQPENLRQVLAGEPVPQTSTQ